MTTMHQFRMELAAILGVGPRELPEVFYGTRPQLLNVGTYGDLIKRYPDVDGEAVRDWVGRYTSQRAYLKQAVYGQWRHSLGGYADQAVTGADRRRARRRLALIALAPRPSAPAAHAQPQEGAHASA